MKIHPGNYYTELCSNGYSAEHLAFFSARKYQPQKINAFLNDAENAPSADVFKLYIEKLRQAPSNEQVLGLIAEDVASLDEHLFPTGRGYHFPQVRISAMSGHDEYEYEVFWVDNVARGEVIWNRCNFHCEDALLFMLKLEEYFDFLPPVVYANKLNVQQFRPCALYRYHPERYKQNRAFFTPCLEIMRRNTDLSRGLMTSIDSLNAVVAPLVDEVNRKATNTPLKPRVHENLSHMIIQNEMTMLQNIGLFHLCGKQIIDIDSKLSEMFKRTDVDDIPLNMLQLPFTSQYIHFGRQEDIELELGWNFDGAYVEKFPEDNSLRITITSVPKSETQTRLWYVNPEPMYHQRIENANSSIDLITAITQVFSDTIQRIQSRESTDLASLSMPDGLSVVDVSRRNDQDRLAHNEKGFEGLTKAIKLIANAICYLSAYPEDNDPVWPDDAPDSLVRKANGEDRKIAERSQSKLEKLGYHKLRYYGKHFENNLHETNIGGRTSHWRRGHWRRQPYGPNSSLRKLKWLMPMLIGSSGADTGEIIGHIYSTDQSN